MKEVLHRYLQEGRDALVWKLDGLSEYDKRRPLVRTGTNLLGLVKHTALVESGYLGDTFGRPYEGWAPAMSEESANANGDMWATRDESSHEIIDFYRGVWAHSDETIESLPLHATGTVPWWPPEHAETTLGHLIVRVVAETNRHAGQADVVRELIDGTAGLRAPGNNLPDRDEAWWTEYRQALEGVALSFRPQA